MCQITRLKYQIYCELTLELLICKCVDLVYERNVFNVNNIACQFENFIDVLPRKMQFPFNTIPTSDSSQSPTADLFAKKFWRVFTMTPQKKKLYKCQEHGSGQILIFHQPRFPWNNGISLPTCYLLGAQVVWGRYILPRMVGFDARWLLGTLCIPLPRRGVDISLSNGLSWSRLKPGFTTWHPKNTGETRDAAVPVDLWYNCIKLEGSTYSVWEF